MARVVTLGFVIYNHGDDFLERVRMAIESGFEVYIFDNSPKGDFVNDFSANKERIKYFTCGKNLGLGFGISFVCAQAYYENYSSLVFFDQDSIFSLETLNFIESFYLDHPHLEKTHSAVVFSSKDCGKNQSQDFFKDVPLAINSGSLFYLKNLKALNWHSEKYFVDCVDYEFCLRSLRAHLRVGEYSCTPGFDHVSGQADKKYNFLGRSYSMRPYSLSRIIDTSKASLKLILTAAASGNFKFSARIGRLYIIYAVTQTIVRLLNPVDMKRES